MAKYEIIETIAYGIDTETKAPKDAVLISFRGTNGLIDSITVLAKDFTLANTDTLIDQALANRK